MRPTHIGVALSLLAAGCDGADAAPATQTFLDDGSGGVGSVAATPGAADPGAAEGAATPGGTNGTADLPGGSASATDDVPDSGAPTTSVPPDNGYCEGEMFRDGDICTECSACNWDADGTAFCNIDEVECPDCVSPSQNLDLADQASGCHCDVEASPSICISRQQSDGSTRYIALECAGEWWTVGEGGPCAPRDAESACAHLVQRRLEALETVPCPADSEQTPPCRKTIEFREGGSYDWDTVESAQGGMLECDGLELFVLIGLDRVPMGSYDPDSRTLLWDGEEYR